MVHVLRWLRQIFYAITIQTDLAIEHYFAVVLIAL